MMPLQDLLQNKSVCRRTRIDPTHVLGVYGSTILYYLHNFKFKFSDVRREIHKTKYFCATCNSRSPQKSDALRLREQRVHFRSSKYLQLNSVWKWMCTKHNNWIKWNDFILLHFLAEQKIENYFLQFRRHSAVVWQRANGQIIKIIYNKRIRIISWIRPERRVILMIVSTSLTLSNREEHEWCECECAHCTQNEHLTWTVWRARAHTVYLWVASVQVQDH